MIDLQTIRNFLVDEIWKYTGGEYDEEGKPVEGSGVPIVDQNDVGERPGYPFNTYSFIVPYTPAPGFPGLINKVVEDEEGKEWVEQARIDFPTFTLSLNSYAKNPEEAWDKAFQLYRFFEFDKVWELYEEGLVVVEAHGMEDRSTLLEMQREYRVGFDVNMRTTSKITKLIDFIDKVEINEEPLDL